MLKSKKMIFFNKMGEGELVVKSQSVDTGLRMGEDQGKS